MERRYRRERAGFEDKEACNNKHRCNLPKCVTVGNTPFPPSSRHLSAVAETIELGRHAAVFTWSILFYMRVVQKYEQKAVYIWNNRHVFGCIGKLTCRSSRICKYLSMLYFRFTRNVIYKRVFIFVMSAQSTWRDISWSKFPNPLYSLE